MRFISRVLQCAFVLVLGVVISGILPTDTRVAVDALLPLDGIRSSMLLFWQPILAIGAFVLLVERWLYVQHLKTHKLPERSWQMAITVFWLLVFAAAYVGAMLGLIAEVPVYAMDAIVPLRGEPWVAVMLNVALFSGFYWHLNHLLNLRKRIAYRTEGKYDPDASVERPFDVAMGLAMFAISIVIHILAKMLDRWIHLPPLAYQTALVFVATAAPMVGMFLLGFIRGLQSMTSIMWMGMHALLLSVVVFLFFPAFPDIHSCLLRNGLQMSENERRIACYAMSQFWFDKWLTTSFAFLAVFGAALLGSYSVDIRRLGWRSNERQYSNLAFLFSMSAIVILLESVCLLGIPLLADLLATH